MSLTPLLTLNANLSPWMLAAIPGMLLGLWAFWRLHSAYRYYSKIHSKLGVTGGKAARLLLDRNGMANVEIFESSEEASDHFDPRRRAIFLSSDVAYGDSVAAIAIAAHEVGHAVQNRVDYHFFRFRMFVVGMTGLATSSASVLFFLSLFLSDPISWWLMSGSVLLYVGFVFLQLLTLPVELNASTRAKNELIKHGLIAEEELRSVRTMLHVAAVSYVGSLLTSLFRPIVKVFNTVTGGVFRRQRD